MNTSDKANFLKLVGDVHGFYNKPFNAFSGNVWWEALKPYDFAAINQAFSRHAVNPDNGQFAPRPADIVRMMGGTSGDAALGAWSKVERAIRSIGQYESLLFDDPLIHRVIEDMGGWVKMCSCPSEDDFVFVAKEFQTRYRGFAMRSERPPYPRCLIGLAEASNAKEHLEQTRRIRMVGDPEKCQAVYRNGGDQSALPVALLEVGKRLPQLENKP